MIDSDDVQLESMSNEDSGSHDSTCKARKRKNTIIFPPPFPATAEQYFPPPIF